MKKYLVFFILSFIFFSSCEFSKTGVMLGQRSFLTNYSGQKTQKIYKVIFHLIKNRYIITQSDKLTYINGYYNIEGIMFEYNRHPVPGHFTIHNSEVLFIEVEKNIEEFGSRALTTALLMASAGTIYLTFYCIENPKACYGSCPTFYNNRGKLVAEGFSRALARKFEYPDIDDIDISPDSAGFVKLRMRNEALETQGVKYVYLLELNEKKGTIYKTIQNKFIEVDNISPPIKGDTSLFYNDTLTYLTPADSQNLALQDTTFLYFNNPGRKHLSIQINARNSLLETYIFYGIIEKFGKAYYSLIRRLDGAGKVETAYLMKKLRNWYNYGNLNVYTMNKNKWKLIGKIEYEGPIAFDKFAIPFTNPKTDTIKIMIVKQKGEWEINSIQIGNIIRRNIPYHILKPVKVIKGNTSDSISFHLLLNKKKHLFVYPGDEYTLIFKSVKNGNKFFLISEGYYYEWMRDIWLGKENIAEGKRFLKHPLLSYKYFASEYKKNEKKIRQIFYKSKYTRR